ncbi:hypothetical protein CWI37_0711p0020 [Hamiltosporidium tvaerminnensis]|uniref:Uncharacterized protein n=1 Tax=Hamiltosporidium tvaerminnensis TaxID=1176355 RepID=A0A4Q9L4G3_9MICR|nr:hypothetical protein CWI37_0711p0020 [Hamiltosporidium tvaerminnensis]
MEKYCLILIICIKHIYTSELEYFLNTDIKIMFSAYEHFHLALKTADSSKYPFIGISRHLNAKEYNFDDRARITKNSDRYEISIGEEMLCKEKKTIIKCGETGNSAWSIDKRDFGYTISQDKMCITKKDSDEIILSKCSDTEDQLFDFKRSAGIGKCSENQDVSQKNEKMSKQNKSDTSKKSDNSKKPDKSKKSETKKKSYTNKRSKKADEESTSDSKDQEDSKISEEKDQTKISLSLDCKGDECKFRRISRNKDNSKPDFNDFRSLEDSNSFQDLLIPIETPRNTLLPGIRNPYRPNIESYLIPNNQNFIQENVSLYTNIPRPFKSHDVSNLKYPLSSSEIERGMKKFDSFFFRN